MIEQNYKEECKKGKCKSVRRESKKLNYNYLKEQVDKCEDCCYRKKKETWKHETYKHVRINYVESYHNNFRRKT